MARLDIDIKSSGIQKTRREITQLDKSIEELRRENLKLEKQLKSLDKTSDNYAKTEKELTKRIVDNSVAIKNNRREQQLLERQNKQSTQSVSMMNKAVGALGVAFATLQLKDLVVDISNTGKQFEALTVSLNSAVGGAEEGASALKFLRDQSNRLGTDLLASAKGFKEFSASAKGTAFTTKQIRDIFREVSEAGAVMQLSNEELEGTFRALSQMISKGTVQAEELKGQLGERLPGAFQIASRAMGVTTQELGKMLQNGEVMAYDLLPALATELNKTFTDKEVLKASDTLSANQVKFNNALRDAKLAIAESGLNEFMKEMTKESTNLLRTFTKFLNASRSTGSLDTIDKLNQKLEVLRDRRNELLDRAKAQPLLADTFYANASTIGNQIAGVERKIRELTGAEAERNEVLKEQEVIKTKKAEADKKEEQRKKDLAERDKERTKALKQLHQEEQRQVKNARLLEEYYETIGDASQQWIEKEKQIRIQYKGLNENLDEFVLAKKEEFYDKLEDLTADSIEAEFEAREKATKDTIKSFKEIETVWDKTTKSLYDSMEDNFFNLITGRFDSFKDYLKGFGEDILRSVTDPLARNLSKTLSGGILGSIGLGNQAIAETLTGAGFKQIGGNFVNSAGSTISATGNIISNQGGFDLSLLSNLSNARSLYGLATNGLTSTITSPFSSLANLFQAGGTANVGIGSFGAGVASPFSQMGANFGGNALAFQGGQILGGAGIGFGVGKLGDALLGADTRAGSYGAIGSAIGTAILPGLGTAIGAGLGSLVGGLFGKTKVRGSGLSATGSIDRETLGSIQAYTDFRRKSWFSSKTWTEYKEIDEKTKEAIDGTFQTLNRLGDVLLGTIGTNLSVSGGKFAGVSLITEALPSALIAEVGSSASISLWQDYAKEVNKTLIETLTESTFAFQGTLREVDLFNAEDTLTKLELQSQFSREDYEAVAKSIGVDSAKITVDNFNEQYRKAIKEDFSPETIEQWEALADVLLTATDTANKYKTAMEQAEAQQKSFIDNATSSLNDFLATNFSNFANSFSNMFTSIDSMINSTVSTLSNIRTSGSQFERLSEFNRVIAEFTQSRGTTDTGRTSQLYSQVLSIGQSLAQDPRYRSSVQGLLSENLADFDIQKDTIRVNIVDGLSELLKLNEEQTVQLKESVKDGSITNSELTNITNLTEIQKQGILDVANNSQFFSTESTLSSLEEFAKLQLATLRKTSESQTESLSAKTFKFGDSVGLQEQIDISRLLGTQYSQVAPLVSSLQGLELVDNKRSDVESLLEFSGTSINEETYQNIQKLAPFIPETATVATSVRDSAKFNLDKQLFTEQFNQEKQIFEKEKAESDALLTDLTSNYVYERPVWTNENLEEGIPANVDYAWIYGGVRKHQVGARDWIRYKNEFAETYESFKKLEAMQLTKEQKGFSSGGYTGQGNKFDVRGAVHADEYVIKSSDLKNVGGVGAVENFLRGNVNTGVNMPSNKKLEFELSELKGYMQTLVNKNIELVRYIKNVTQGGTLMQCELTQ